MSIEQGCLWKCYQIPHRQLHHACAMKGGHGVPPLRYQTCASEILINSVARHVV